LEGLSVEQIEELELRIEELQERIGRSQRLMLLGRVCTVLGPVLLLALLLGLLSFTPVEMIIGITLGIGGIVLMGSSKATEEGLGCSLKKIEEERSAAIDALELVRIHDRANQIEPTNF
jgi:hypothetical protein